MPRGVYEIKCKNKSHPLFKPLNHQEKAANYFLSSPHKGLLLYHLLGSGKTATSILIADKMLQEKKVKHVYILTPGSLRENWVTEYCERAGKDPKDLEKYFSFVTYNFGGATQIQSFDNSLVIIDEAHNFINSVKNLSKTAVYLYAKLFTCGNCRVVALTGTPIYKDIAEFSLLGNLLKPGAFPNVIISGEYHPENFDSLFKKNDDGTMTPIDPNTWKKALEGIISYSPGVGSEFYPEVVYHPVIKAKMSKEQEKAAYTALVNEARLRVIDPRTAKQQGANAAQLILAKKYMMSRPVFNFWYPPIAYKNYNEYMETFDKFGKLNKTSKKELKQSGNKLIKLEKLPDDFKENNGWITKETIGNGKLKIYSNKYIEIFKNIIKHPRSKHAIYTIGRDISGAYLIQKLLQSCGLKSLVFTGDLTDKKRKELLELYNNPWNKYGQIIPIIIFSKAGAEGITIKDIQHLHITESEPRGTLINQVIGRANRFKSHENLPKKFRKLNVWKYWSVFENDQGGKLKGIDELLYDKANLQLVSLNSFLQTLKDSTI